MMNLKISLENVYRPEYTVTVYGPAQRDLTYRIVKLDDGLWRAHNLDNGFCCLYWADTDLQTQFRWVYGALRKDIHERRAARKDRKRRWGF